MDGVVLGAPSQTDGGGSGGLRPNGWGGSGGPSPDGWAGSEAPTVGRRVSTEPGIVRGPALGLIFPFN